MNLNYQYGNIKFDNKQDYELYLLMNEASRVLSLAYRYKSYMVDVYSKFRTRSVFADFLKFKYENISIETMAQFEPEIGTGLLFVFDTIHELRTYLNYTSSLPVVVEAEIDSFLRKLSKVWAVLVDEVKAQKNWDFDIL